MEEAPVLCQSLNPLSMCSSVPPGHEKVQNWQWGNLIQKISKYKRCPLDLIWAPNVFFDDSLPTYVVIALETYFVGGEPVLNEAKIAVGENFINIHLWIMGLCVLFLDKRGKCLY